MERTLRAVPQPTTEEDVIEKLTEQVMDKLYGMSEDEFLTVAANLLDLDKDKLREALKNARSKQSF
jgi:hypothetical protein